MIGIEEVHDFSARLASSLIPIQGQVRLVESGGCTLPSTTTRRRKAAHEQLQSAGAGAGAAVQLTRSEQNSFDSLLHTLATVHG